jgi:hypothetical protein
LGLEYLPMRTLLDGGCIMWLTWLFDGWDKH